MATVGKEESGCCGEVVFFREYNMFIVLISCLLHLGGVIHSYVMMIEIKYTKNMNNVLNQNVNVTKRAWFATFANRS